MTIAVVAAPTAVATGAFIGITIVFFIAIIAYYYVNNIPHRRIPGRFEEKYMCKEVFKRKNKPAQIKVLKIPTK